MILKGTEVHVWMEAHPDQVGTAGTFTGQVDSSNDQGLTIVRSTKLGEWEGVFIPWDKIRYVTYRTQRPRG